MTGMLAAVTYGATAAAPPPSGSVQLHDQSITKATTGTATATYTVSADGKIRNSSGTILETWMLSGVASDYEVRATLISGTVTGSATATWLGCGPGRNWSRSNSAHDDSTLTSQFTAEIRNASTLTVLASATITLNAESLSA